jgi:hypothetical protein
MRLIRSPPIVGRPTASVFEHHAAMPGRYALFNRATLTQSSFLVARSTLAVPGSVAERASTTAFLPPFAQMRALRQSVCRSNRSLSLKSLRSLMIDGWHGSQPTDGYVARDHNQMMLETQ